MLGRLNICALISLLISTTTSCPVPLCNCYHVPNEAERMIDCREKQLQHIPKIIPSDEVFSEITFQNEVDFREEPCGECNSIQSIRADDFRGLKVRKIDLWNNGVESVNEDAFRGLEQTLEQLVLSGNGSSKPPFLSLRNLAHLRKLELGHFNMDRIDPYNTFQDFPNMEALKLMDMKLRYIDSKAFEGRLKQLKHLEITGNQKLVIFPVMAFRKLPSITELIYKDNGLTRLPRKSFLKLKQLKSLDMSYNKIRELRRGCFRTITRSLEYINFDHNRLSEGTIRPLMRHPWRKLRHLRMSWNLLRKIPRDMFIRMKNSILTASFFSNQLTKISKTDFTLHVPEQLVSLDLSKNPLQAIAPGAFASLSKLSTLKLIGLNDNSKRVLSLRGVFGGLNVSLTDLRMRRTRVNTTDLWREISTLLNIHHLDLSSMNLDTLKDHAFKYNAFLKSLDLSRNNLRGEISERQLYGTQSSLQILKLSKNKIQFLDHCIFNNFKELRKIMLFGNPLVCDCRARGLQTWIKQKQLTNPLIPYIVQGQCQEPVTVAGRDIHTIPAIGSEGKETCDMYSDTRCTQELFNSSLTL